MMKIGEAKDLLSEAEEKYGYTFSTRHQPAVDHEDPDWIVLVTTPEGRRVFPGAIDNVEEDAIRRAAKFVQRDMARRSTLDA